VTYVLHAVLHSVGLSDADSVQPKPVQYLPPPPPPAPQMVPMSSIAYRLQGTPSYCVVVDDVFSFITVTLSFE